MLPTLLASLFLPGARAGSCADSATLDYPVGLDFQRGSRAPPYEALGGSAGFTISAWVYRERTTYARDHLFHFYNSATGSDIALNFQHSMKYDVKISPPDEDVEAVLDFEAAAPELVASFLHL